MDETGVVKFRCDHSRVALEKFAGFDELNECRRELLARGWIGADENGIGFGNLSVREGDTPRFFITGSGTGAKRELSVDDYAHVIKYDTERNWLGCEGITVASSESLTHAAVYHFCAGANAVIHIHDIELWKETDGKLPSTADDVEYGTPAMAKEVARLAVANKRLFRMAGHAGGLLVFGPNLREALHQLVALRGS